MELIPGLPEEIGVECLTRFSLTTHQAATHVCRRWRELLQSNEFHNLRKQSGFTQKLACLVQSLPVQPDPKRDPKPITQPSYGITTFDPSTHTWTRLNPIPKYPHGLPFFCELTSVEGKLVLMGGWNPVSWEPVKDVFIYDFATQLWRQGKDMPSKRSLFAAAALNGRVLIAGGHDESKLALRSAWLYDARKDEWSELSEMNEERDECEGVVIGNEFCVVSGYGTEEQGKFKGSVEFYELESDRWRKIDGVWEEGVCPKGNVGVNRSGGFSCLGELDPVVRVGACGVELGELTLVSGSAYEGGTPGFYIMGMKMKGQSCKLDKIEAPEDFSGFVQSGCFVEV